MEIKTNLEKIKKLLGIRNRFWRKKYTILEPEIKNIYIKSIVKNYFPFRLAFGKFILKLYNKNYTDEYDLKKFYYKHLVKFLNLYKIFESQLLFKYIEHKNQITISVVNPDGTIDTELRKNIIEISEKIISSKEQIMLAEKINSELIDEYFVNILKPQYFDFFSNKKSDIFSQLMESPPVKILNSVIPGLSFLIEIQKLRNELQTEDIYVLSRKIISQRISSFLQKNIYQLFKQFSYFGKIAAPVLSATFTITLERYDSYQNCLTKLEKNLSRIQLIKKEIDNLLLEAQNQKEMILQISPEEEYRKLLDF